MNLEITNWNNSIINKLTTDDDIFITKTNLNESIIDDSNYVSEDSVTLTEGSVEKDEDSLEYQNEYGNIDSITNSISGEFRDLNEKCINKGLHSKNFEVEESYLKPLDLKEELKNGNLLKENENLIKEIVLHNIILESDNGKITSLTSTTELESDKMDKENDNSDDLNFYDCEDSESDENNCNKYGNFENNLNRSYDIVSENFIDIEKIKSDSPDLSSMTNNCKNDKCSSNANSDKSALKFSEICDASSDELCLDYNNQDFVSSNWLMSVNPDVNNDEFDIENVFSFKKMKLTHFKINEPLSLCFEISRKYPQLNNNVHSSFQNNDTPIDFTKIFSSSTPLSVKHKNHNKNETFSKSGTLECKFPVVQTENVEPESIEIKNKTFNLEEIIKERKSIDTKTSVKPDLVAPCLQLTDDFHDNEAVDLTSVTSNKLLDSKLHGLVPEKPSRLSKKIGSLIAIPSKSNPPSDNRPTENKSSLKLPMDPPKPPSNQSAAALKKLFSKTSSRDTIAPMQSLNGVKTRSLPLFDPNRRHTITVEVFSSPTDPKSSSRPTSLIKPNESKPPIGNCRIAKPIRPSSVISSDKAQKSLPAASSSQKESGIPKTVKSMKLQSGAQKKSRNPRSSEISSKIDECSAIVTPIISENPPIISPTASSSISNPLNRTFDRDDFQILKSSSSTLLSNSNSNSNNNDNSSSESSSSSNDATIRSSTASSSADSENNNNNNSKSQSSSLRSSEQLGGIYQLARKEEEDLKKHVSRQTAGFRSLRLPAQIKPRLVAPAALGK